ncbi:MAG: hypothetical protein A3B78_00345 [Omnitrophica WOR_2 bacterium RIFCSPHIGHO2_02_FULL_67_20]|nr:MAG: hypothetical protein A3B78_00345 [Omnitrophica WOR_2 bacterium RIFCSPHIGHO2_02_FULL_67_20]
MQPANRLGREQSPYLLQHAHNPVDWYPWGADAVAKARREQKPIFLSIGYSTCHWCHVMERESFERPEIAELLNRWFVSIKVDREEHPDLDQVYMHAVTALTGQGGWPLTVFLTPELKPFFGGTYFPPERRGTMTGMKELLPAVAEAWRARREELRASADELTAALGRLLNRDVAPGIFSEQLLHAAFNQAAGAFDPAHGGFGDAPKFPRPHELTFLFRYWARTGAAQSLEMATATLDHIARGGIHDHLGGGFHRYSTDSQWLIPHFEKMLYDQALLARAYLEAYQITRRPEYAEAARGIFAYVLRDLADARGGFYSAEDADSEGEEGKFYAWTQADVLRVLGEEEGGLFARFYGVTLEGNFSAEGSAEGGSVSGGGSSSASGGEHGASVLHIDQPLDAFAALNGLAPDALRRRLAASRERLFAERAARTRPHRDDKILTSWNGLMIASLASGGAALDEPRYLEAARRAADFILGPLVRDGILLRRERRGDARYPGTLEDYAFFADGLLALYEATFEPRWLAEAKRWTDAMVRRFWDEERSGFFFRGKDEEPLIVRAKELYDGATPSGSSVAVLVLLRLGRLTVDERLETLGRRALEAAAPLLTQTPFAYPAMFAAVDVALGPTQEIVIAGDPGSPDTAAMLRAVHERFLPRAVAVLHPQGPERAAVEALIPYVKAQESLGARATAYVCEHFVCTLPTHDLTQLIELLQASGASAARGRGEQGGG